MLNKMSQSHFYGHHGTWKGWFWPFLAQNTLESLLVPQISEISPSMRPELRLTIVLNITGEQNELWLFLWPSWRQHRLILAIFDAQNTLKSILYPQICELSTSVRPEVRSSIVLNITGEKNDPKPYLWPLWHLKRLILAIFSLKHIEKSLGSANKWNKRTRET